MDLFNDDKDSGQGATEMLMGTNRGDLNLSEYRYRVEMFTLGNSNESDDIAELESILTRSINPNRDLVIIERKDSISSTTGVYTCVLIYMERRVNREGNTNA